MLVNSGTFCLFLVLFSPEIKNKSNLSCQIKIFYVGLYNNKTKALKI